jgi:hypothetical protein
VQEHLPLVHECRAVCVVQESFCVPEVVLLAWRREDRACVPTSISLLRCRCEVQCADSSAVPTWDSMFY